jgi:hypothetical protein
MTGESGDIILASKYSATKYAESGIKINEK